MTRVRKLLMTSGYIHKALEATEKFAALNENSHLQRQVQDFKKKLCAKAGDPEKLEWEDYLVMSAEQNRKVIEKDMKKAGAVGSVEQFHIQNKDHYKILDEINTAAIPMSKTGLAARGIPVFFALFTLSVLLTPFKNIKSFLAWLSLAATATVTSSIYSESAIAKSVEEIENFGKSLEYDLDLDAVQKYIGER